MSLCGERHSENHGDEKNVGRNDPAHLAAGEGGEDRGAEVSDPFPELLESLVHNPTPREREEKYPAFACE